MKIMEIVSGWNVNGAIITCLETSRALLDRGHEITLVCRPGAWISRQFANQSNVDVVFSDLRRWPTSELKRIADIARARKIDVIHTHMSRAHFFGVLLRHLYKLPCVATANNRYIQLHWMFNDRVIAASEANRKFHSRRNLVPKRRIDVVHNFVHYENYGSVPPRDQLAIRRELGIDHASLIVGQVGKVISRKGFIYAVRALPAILASVPDAKLLAIGDLEEKEYVRNVRREAAELGVDHAIVWAGHRSDIGKVVSILDVMVLPTLEDSLPLAILEAMASRVPVVASTVGGISECVFDGKTGYLIRPGNVEDLVSSVTRLLQSERVRKRMGEAARQRVIDDFSPQSQIMLVEDTLRRAAA